MAFTGKFQIGDTVQITAEVIPSVTSAAHRIGQTHKITNIDETDKWPYELGGVTWWEEEGLKLVSKAGITLKPSLELKPHVTELKFKVGDRVAWTDDFDDVYNCYIAEIDASEDCPYYLPEADEWVAEDEIVAAPLKYKAGDKVVYEGKIRTIVSIDTEDADMPYKLEDDSWCEEEELELAPKATGLSSLKYKVGDSVMFNGREDTIDVVCSTLIQPYHLKNAKLFVTESAISPKVPVTLKKSEVPSDSFKVSDRVVAECAVGRSRLRNQHGKLIEIRDGSYVVEFDNHIEGHKGLHGSSIQGRDGHCWLLCKSDLKKEVLVRLTSTEVVSETRAAMNPCSEIVMQSLYEPAWCTGIGLKIEAEPLKPAASRISLVQHPEPVKLVPCDVIHGDEPVYSYTGAIEKSKKERKSDRFMKALKNLFGDVSIGVDKSGRFAMSPLGVAVKDGTGKFVVYKDGKLVDVMDIVFDVEGAFYRLPAQEIEVGDVIINGGFPVIVKAKNDVSTTVINPISGKEEVIVATGNILGLPKFYVKVTNMFGNVFQANGDNPMASMLPLMLLSDDGGDLKDMLPLMMMSGGLGGNAAGGANLNNLLPLMLLSDSGDDKMETLLMMQMFGNGGLNLFGQNNQ